MYRLFCIIKGVFFDLVSVFVVWLYCRTQQSVSFMGTRK